MSAAGLRACALGVCLALCAPPTAQSQQTRKAASVGLLVAGGANFDAGIGPFRQRLRELGYVDGRSVTFVVRNAEGSTGLLPDFAADLVRIPVDVIVVQGNAALSALKKTNQTIPVVMATIGDPVGAGFVASLAKPGGNVTGLTNMGEGVATKWVQPLKQAAPKSGRLAVLWDARNVAHQTMWREIQGAGTRFGYTARAWHATALDEIERAFDAMQGERMDAVIVLPYPQFNVHRRRVSQLAIDHGLPCVYTFREFVEAGCLMAYGPSVAGLWSRSAEYVDKILKGTRPMDLPVAQPTTFDFAINLKTANALGITIPRSLLVQATEIIE